MAADGVRLVKHRHAEPRAYAKPVSLAGATLLVGPGFREGLGGILIAVPRARLRSVLKPRKGDVG